YFFFLLPASLPPPHLLSFPTRRSSDLDERLVVQEERAVHVERLGERGLGVFLRLRLHVVVGLGRTDFARVLREAEHGIGRTRDEDRKSTGLNSSHLVISYAVFCLKKKKRDSRKQTFLSCIMQGSRVGHSRYLCAERGLGTTFVRASNPACRMQTQSDSQPRPRPLA